MTEEKSLESIIKEGKSKMTNKNKKINEDTINAELFGNDQKGYIERFWDGINNIEDKNTLNKKTKNIVNPEKLVKYEFNSYNPRSVRIPLKHAYKARKLLNIALESEDLEEFNNKVSLWPSLKEVYVPGAVKSFIAFPLIASSDEKMKKSFKLYDQAYIETCLHMAYDDLSRNNIFNSEYGKKESGLERLQKIKNVENIKNILGRL